MYLTGRTDEDVQKERDEVLSANVGKLQALAPVIRAVLDEKTRCTVGSASAIEAAKDLFGEVTTLS